MTKNYEDHILKILKNSDNEIKMNRDILILVKGLRILHLEETKYSKFTKDCYTIIVKSIFKRLDEKIIKN